MRLDYTGPRAKQARHTHTNNQVQTEENGHSLLLYLLLNRLAAILNTLPRFVRHMILVAFLSWVMMYLS